jgi:hypothetical protein
MRRLLVAGGLPAGGLTLVLVTTARYLQADVLALVVVSYLGLSTLSWHGLLRLQEHEALERRHAAAGEANVLDIGRGTRLRSAQPKGPGLSGP